MKQFALPCRPFTRTLAALGTTAAFLFILPGSSHAATENAGLRLRPHCEAINQQQCASYTVKDPLTLQTPEIIPGSVLDMDLVIDNPTGQPISRVRGWLSYDPVIFEGKKIEISPRFPIVTPGEADFSPMQGTIQIGIGSELATPVKDPIIPIARIQLTVKLAPSGGRTVIAFFDVRSGQSGHTYVSVKEGGIEQNILSKTLGSLLVVMRQNGAAASSANTSTTAVPSQNSSVSVSLMKQPRANSAGSSAAVTHSRQDRSAFLLVQVQNVRVTTEGSTVYLAWDPLPSSELSGYNVYYGAVSGRYLQRRSLPASENSIAIRALPMDTMYYFAVRAVNASENESAFSQEVGIKVGDPKSATAPLIGGTRKGSKGSNGKNPLDTPKKTVSVPGETGIPSTVLLLIIVSAGLGTLLAFRRQFTAAPAL